MANGDTVKSGEKVIGYSIREWIEDGVTRYDWIADDARGGYSESDYLFDTIEEAEDDLGL